MNSTLPTQPAVTPRYLRQVASRTGLDGIAETLNDAASTIEARDSVIELRNHVIKILENDLVHAHKARRDAQAETEYLKSLVSLSGINARDEIAQELKRSEQLSAQAISARKG